MSDVVRESVAAYGAPLRKMTVREYHRATEKGVFDWQEKLELIRGEVVVLSPQMNRHSSATYRLVKALELVFRDAVVRCQLPLHLDDMSEPEPDVLVAVGPAIRYDSRHPDASDTLLVCEVADSSLSKDRKLKAPLYAEFGIAEYWILDLTSNRLEVYRDPVQLADSRWDYSSVETLAAQGQIAPLRGNGSAMPVSSVIPT